MEVISALGRPCKTRIKMPNTEEKSAAQLEMEKAFMCLYAECHESVVNDVKAKVYAYIDELKQAK